MQRSRTNNMIAQHRLRPAFKRKRNKTALLNAAGPIAGYAARLAKNDFLKAMEVFVCVCDSGGMTAAAQILGLTQSAVSQHVKQLELELAQRLLDRSVRPLRPTRAGFVLRNMAADFISDAAKIQSIVRSIGEDPLQQLRIAAIGSLAGTLIPPLVGGLMDHFKVRAISVRRGLATSNDNALVRREADLLITSDPMLDIPQLERYPLYSEPFVLLAPNDSALETMNLGALAKTLPFIRYSKDFITGRAIENHLYRLRVEPENALEFDSSLDIVAMAASRRGWAITTPSSVFHGLSTAYNSRYGSRIRVAPLAGPEFRRTIFLIVRANELGELPLKFAFMSCGVIRKDFLPRVYALGQWLRREMRVADPARL